MADTEHTLLWLLKASVEYLKKKNIDNAKSSIEFLAASLLDCKRSQLPLYFDKIMSPSFIDSMRDGMKRLLSNEPIQYILGNWDFREITLKTDKRALIPRPETEELVGLLLSDNSITSLPSPAILDYGTGSGCIALSIAKELPNARIVAIDVSEDALSLARENANFLGLSNKVTFINSSEIDLGDLFEPESFNAIISNPPYIPTSSYLKLDASVKDFEPRLALDGGDDGMNIVRAIIDDSSILLANGGSIFLELSAEDNQPEELSSYLQSLSFENIKVTQDAFKAKRFLSGTLPPGI